MIQNPLPADPNPLAQIKILKKANITNWYSTPAKFTNVLNTKRLSVGENRGKAKLIIIGA